MRRKNWIFWMLSSISLLMCGQGFAQTNSEINNIKVDGSVTTPSVNNIAYIDGRKYSQSDIGAGINAAYAALPSAGGTIVVPGGTFYAATAISLSTANKPVSIECAAGAILIYTPLSGTFLTENNSSGNAGLQSPRSRIVGCTLQGPSYSGSTIGLLLGGTNGVPGFLCESCTIQNFGVGVQYGNYTWGTEFHNSMIQSNGQLLYYPAGLTGSGENISFTATHFNNSQNFTNAVENLGSEFFCTKCSFDNAQFVNSGVATVSSSHFENPGQNVAPSFIVNTGGLVLDGDEISQDFSSPNMTTMITLNSATTVRTSITGLDATSAGTMTNLILLENAGDLTFVGPRTIQPFTNQLNYTGSGNYWFDFGGGAIKTNANTQMPSLVLGSSSGGTITHSPPSTASNYTITDPAVTGITSLLAVTQCGTMAACSATLESGKGQIVIGTIAFSSSTTASVTGMPAFAAATSYACSVADPTHAYTWLITAQTTTGFTITAGTSNSDTWNWSCVGY